MDVGAVERLIDRCLRGDRAATGQLDLDIDGAVARRDFGEVDRYLRPLASASARGTPGALELLLGLLDNHNIVRSTVAKHVRDPDLLDEACQDALISIARNIDQYEGRARFTTWVYPIAANAGRMVTRSAGRRREDLMGSQFPSIDPSLRRMSSVVVSQAQIRDLVAGLPEHYRAPFELREYGGRSYAEIADELDITVGTVKSRIGRAREQLARSLTP